MKPAAVIITYRYLCSIPGCESEYVWEQKAPYFDMRDELARLSVPPGWREMNSQLVCLEHTVRVTITPKNGLTPKTEMLL